jgi:hypothetical protein
MSHEALIISSLRLVPKDFARFRHVAAGFTGVKKEILRPGHLRIAKDPNSQGAVKEDGHLRFFGLSENQGNPKSS